MTQHILKMVNFCLIQLSNMLHQNHLFEINTAGSVTWFNKSHEMNFHNWLTAFKACNLSFGILNLFVHKLFFRKKPSNNHLVIVSVTRSCKFNCWSLHTIYIHSLNTRMEKERLAVVSVIDFYKIWFSRSTCPLSYEGFELRQINTVF